MNLAFAGILASDGAPRPETRTIPILGHFESITRARSKPLNVPGITRVVRLLWVDGEAY